MSYTLRIRQNTKVSNSKGELVSAENLFRDLGIGQQKCLTNRTVLGIKTNISAIREEDGSLKVIISSHGVHSMILRYEEREQIERMFSCLKRRGFNFK